MKNPDRVAIAGTVHDFNNALQLIGASLNLIERRLPQDGNPDIRRLLHGTREQLANAGSLVRRMLLNGHLAEEHVDLCALVRDMAPQIEAAMGDGIALNLCVDGARQTVLCDPLNLKSGLLNTVLNARDAMDGDGTLTISVRRVELDGSFGNGHGRPGRFVQVVVTDTGQGMDETLAAHAFEPYVTTKAAGHGTGLGLFQLRSFVEGSRGFVQLDSRRGMGASVTISLPLAE